MLKELFGNSFSLLPPRSGVNQRGSQDMSVTKEPFGNEYTLYTITNEKGTQAKVTDLGGTLVSLLLQDKNETMRDVVLGYDTPEEYRANGFFFGAWVGRSGNRIDKAKFELDGKVWQLPVNDNENNLHSGLEYFHLRRAQVTACTENSVTFEIQDAHLRQGFPGNFTGTVTYTLTDDKNASDQDTVCNMTNHSYFNLGGHDSGSILDTQLWMSCEAYTPVIDAQAIPTGEIRPVAGSAFDFTSPRTIGRDIEADDEQLAFGGGYDHNLILNGSTGALHRFATAKSGSTGIILTAYTTEPAIQLYTGNFIQNDTAAHGKNGVRYPRHGGFCLEAQHYPCSPNYPQFPSTVLKKGETYRQTTVYQLSVVE